MEETTILPVTTSAIGWRLEAGTLGPGSLSDPALLLALIHPTSQSSTLAIWE
jgi:hypothetical protein